MKKAINLKKKLRFPENDDDFNEIKKAADRFNCLFESAVDQTERKNHEYVENWR